MMRPLLTVFAVTLCTVLCFAGVSHADDDDDESDSKTLDLSARPNQLPSGYAEYGVVVAFPAGPEFDPPVDRWKYDGIGGWITLTAFARVGITDKIEVDGWTTMAAGHPENSPGARTNRYGGGHLDASYKLSPTASVTVGASFIDPWLAMYGHTTFQHYFMGSKLKPAGHLGGRFGTRLADKVRVEVTPRLTFVADAVDVFGTQKNWLLGELFVRAHTRVYDDFFAGLRVGVRTGDKLSLAANDGATLPVITELRYVADQVDLGFDVGFGSMLTSKDLPSHVAYTNPGTSFYLAAVLNWRLE